jgi:hypothetical protein
MKAEDAVRWRSRFRLCVLHGRKKPYTPWEHAVQASETGCHRSRLGTDRLAYPKAYLPGVAWGQRGTRHDPEGTHEARVHPDDAQYLWRRADGVDAASSWPDRKASDGTLMDVNGPQQITN